MNSIETMIPERLLDVVRQIEVSPDGSAASFLGEEVTARNEAVLAGRLWPLVYLRSHVGSSLTTESNGTPWDLRDEEFEEVLCSRWNAVRRTTVGISGRLADGSISVDLAGVKFKLQPDHPAVFEIGESTVEMSMSALRRGVSPGFLSASSAKPLLQRGTLLRLYASIADHTSVPEVWRDLLDFLETQDFPWQTKVCSVRGLYPRNDAIVVYLPRSAWRHGRRCAELLQATGALATQSSPFAHRLSTGVAAAFEPSDSRPAYRRLSFGQHRARICTEAAIAFASERTEAQHADLATAVQSHCISAEIDPYNPGRNLSSPMIDVLGI